MIKFILNYFSNLLTSHGDSSSKRPKVTRDTTELGSSIEALNQITSILSDLNRNLSDLNQNLVKPSNIFLIKFKTEQMNKLDKVINDHPNPLVRFGKKIFSQTDEDGITLELIRRIGVSNGTFAEFGVGNGTENNTLILLSMGWRGFWSGGEDLLFDTSELDRLSFTKDWITKDNIIDLYKNGLKKLDAEDVDLVSLDLDGNDYYLCEIILESELRPKIFIAEINSIMAPPLEFKIEYDKDFVWDGSDYCGVSAQSLVNLFEKYGYTLICCNALSGANAFFIRNEFVHLFPEVPKSIGDIYSGCNWIGQYGHQFSLKTIMRVISD